MVLQSRLGNEMIMDSGLEDVAIQREEKMETQDSGAQRQVQGQVKWFDPTKGFGFVISAEGGPDILLHANVLRNFGQGSVVDGSAIAILVQDTQRGLQATEVLSITPPETEDSLQEWRGRQEIAKLDRRRRNRIRPFGCLLDGRKRTQAT